MELFVGDCFIGASCNSIHYTLCDSCILVTLVFSHIFVFSFLFFILVCFLFVLPYWSEDLQINAFNVSVKEAAKTRQLFYTEKMQQNDF